MNRYNWIMWRHKRAIAAFERAKTGLQSVLESFHKEAEASDKRVADFQAKIKEEGDARAFINSQRETVSKQIVQLEKILNP